MPRVTSGIFYYFKGERPRDPNAPQLDGTGEILLESADRAAGYFTTRSPAMSHATYGTDAEIALGRSVILLSGAPKQPHCHILVLRDPFALKIHKAQIVLGYGVTPLRQLSC